MSQTHALVHVPATLPASAQARRARAQARRLREIQQTSADLLLVDRLETHILGLVTDPKGVSYDDVAGAEGGQLLRLVVRHLLQSGRLRALPDAVLRLPIHDVQP